MQKIEVQIVSGDGKFLMDPPEIEGVEVIRVANPAKEAITVLNNSFIDRFSGDPDVGFFVFMHADVNLDFPAFISHVRECSGKYDVMGLCGCESLNTAASPLNWFTGSAHRPERRWGCVTHGELGNQKSFFSGDRSDIRDHQVACVDGLCIVMTRKAVDSGLRFNEKLKFDCYDTDLCLNAVMRHSLRIGCLVEPSLVHQSVGRSILDPKFLDCEIEMRKSVGLDLSPTEIARERFRTRTLSRNANTQD